MAQTPTQVLVPVTLVQCLVPIVAEPGDHLMLLNGICIGVDTSHQHQRQEPPRRGPAGVKAQLALPPPAKFKARSRALKGLNRDQLHARIIERADKILAALSIKPMQLAELAAKIGVTKTQIQVAVALLDAKHKLTKPHPSKSGTGHHRLYELRRTT